MATNAYGSDFWIGRIFRSKDPREAWRHVVIADIKGSTAKCHNLLTGEPGKMNSRSSQISLKGLARRWKPCDDAECYCKQEIG